jgi:PleD family two-component response regulator
MQAQLHQKTNVLIACDQNTERWLRMVLSASNKLTYVSELVTVENLLRSREFDFIIASIYFSGFRMFDVLKAARQSELNATTPFLCIRSNASSLAAYADRSTKLALRCLGANYFLDVSDAELDRSASQRAKLRQQLEALIGNKLNLVAPDLSILEPARQRSKSRLSE